MVDPRELLRACQDAIRDVAGTAGSLPAEVAGQLLAPVQRQAELLEKVVQRQLEFEHELVEHALAPARAALDLVDQATAAMRAQAKASRLASDSMRQVADLLDQQVELLEGAIGIVRDPVAAMRWAGTPMNHTPAKDAE